MAETKIEEEYVLIAQRVPPGDNWELEIDKTEVIEGLVPALTAYLRKTKFKGDYKLAPIKGKLYAIKEQEIEVKEPEPEKFDLYGEY